VSDGAGGRVLTTRRDNSLLWEDAARMLGATGATAALGGSGGAALVRIGGAALGGSGAALGGSGGAALVRIGGAALGGSGGGELA
jgi:hypothetical protein